MKFEVTHNKTLIWQYKIKGSMRKDYTRSVIKQDVDITFVIMSWLSEYFTLQ